MMQGSPTSDKTAVNHVAHRNTTRQTRQRFFIFLGFVFAGCLLLLHAAFVPAGLGACDHHHHHHCQQLTTITASNSPPPPQPWPGSIDT